MADDTPKTEQNTIKEVEVNGYKFNVDTDLIDDVDTLEYIERIESRGEASAVLPLLRHIMGVEEFNKLKAHFVKEDGEAHKDQKNYKPRMRMQAMNDTYLAIIEKFDPKD